MKCLRCGYEMKIDLTICAACGAAQGAQMQLQKCDAGTPGPWFTIYNSDGEWRVELWTTEQLANARATRIHQLHRCAVVVASAHDYAPAP